MLREIEISMVFLCYIFFKVVTSILESKSKIANIVVSPSSITYFFDESKFKKVLLDNYTIKFGFGNIEAWSTFVVHHMNSTF